MAQVNYRDIIQSTYELSELVIKTKNNDEKIYLIEEHLKKFGDEPTRCYLPLINNPQWLNTNRPLDFGYDFQGKILVLDFFTYCCINCLHILPYLAALEEKYTYEDGIIVVGVHSGKFDNERSTKNIEKAVLKLGIKHPVVNDEENVLWNELSVSCWPTLFVIGPERQILFTFIGEGFKSQLQFFTDITLSYFKKLNRISATSLAVSRPMEKQSNEILQFPGKLSFNSKRDLLAISDSGNHRVLLISIKKWIIEHCIGGVKPGLANGIFSDSLFRSPQGLAWVSDSVICVADTGNHSIREINIDSKTVRTLVSVNENEFNPEIGKMLSPWDLMYIGEDHDMILKNTLIIAAAGSHQIWAYFFEDVVWMNTYYAAGDCVSIAGNGKEENRNNTYRNRAGFAQPSGLAKCILNGKSYIVIADSESSSIRLMSLDDGSVKGLVGGERDPLNLFAFGDIDGQGVDVKLQHPMAVAWNKKNELVYVADSYNHKIKIVNINDKVCKTLVRGEGAMGFDEPNGLIFDPTYSKLFIADTNNHKVKVLTLETNEIKVLPIQWKQKVIRRKADYSIECPTIVTTIDQEVECNVKIIMPKDYHLNHEAPHSVKLYMTGNVLLLDAMDPQPIVSMTETSVSFIIRIPSFDGSYADKNVDIELEAEVFCCDEDGMCWKKNILFYIPIFINTSKNKFNEIRLLEFVIPPQKF